MNENTAGGSLFLFEVKDGVITSADPYLVFDGAARKLLSDKDDGIPKIKTLKEQGQDDECVYFGAYVKYMNGWVRIAKTTKSQMPSYEYTESINLSKCEPEIYEYNEFAAAGEKINAISFEDIILHSLLTDMEPREIEVRLPDNTVIKTQTPAWGMMNYMFVRRIGNQAEIFNYPTIDYDCFLL